MKNLFILFAVLMISVCSCNDGMGDHLTGVITWNWIDIPDQAQSAILNSGIDTSQLIIYDNLTQAQKDVFLELGRDITKVYRIQN